MVRSPRGWGKNRAREPAHALMSKFLQADLRRVRTISVGKRKSKVRLKDFAGVFDPESESFSDFISSLPRILVAEDLRNLVEDIVRARKKEKPVIALIGAH